MTALGIIMKEIFTSAKSYKLCNDGVGKGSLPRMNNIIVFIIYC